MNTAIEVNHVTKSFRVYLDKGYSLKEKILFRRRNQYEERIVLNDVSFSINRGEALGLIGKNGCGKSTTLKLLNKIIYPDSGVIQTVGRISSLIELGAGFHPDMSGRENIFTNAAIFGLNRREIAERLGTIIEFSEMEDFLDNPVRTYSSGMYMRLAFSVAINVDADILLIDEILGVGDVSFQAKCFEKLREIKASGTTIVIVSHSLGQVEQICDRTIWFEDGHIKEIGIPKFVHEHYLQKMSQDRMEKIEQKFQKTIAAPSPGNSPDEGSKTSPNPPDASGLNAEAPDYSDDPSDSPNPRKTGNRVSFGSPNAIRRGNQTAFFTNVFLENSSGSQQLVFKTGDRMTLHLFYQSTVDRLEANVGYAVYRDDGLYCYGTNCIFEMGDSISLRRSGEIVIEMDSISFLPNKYMFDVAIQSPDGIEYDNICYAVEFQIMMHKRDTGICRIESRWSLVEPPALQESEPL